MREGALLRPCIRWPSKARLELYHAVLEAGQHDSSRGEDSKPTANSPGPVISDRCALDRVFSGEGVTDVRSPYLVGLSSGSSDVVGSKIRGVSDGEGVKDLFNSLICAAPAR